MSQSSIFNTMMWLHTARQQHLDILKLFSHSRKLSVTKLHYGRSWNCISAICLKFIYSIILSKKRVKKKVWYATQ